MNLYNTIQKVLNTASSHILVNEVGEGDIYEYLNSGEHKYPCVFLTVTSVVDNEYTRNINGTLFYVDRLLANQSNKTSIQSVAVSVLRDMLQALNVDVDTIEYNTFTEKFTDLCAGAYVDCQIPIDFTSLCEDNFEMKVKSITENGIYEIEGYSAVDVKVVPKVVLGNNIKLGCSTFTEVPDYFDFSQTTNYNKMFYFSQNLYTIPQIDTRDAVNFSNMFKSCSSLKFIPHLNTAKGIDFSMMFADCDILTTIPQLDTSSGTDFSSMFEGCESLTMIPQLNTSKGKVFSYMFYDCKNLTTIPELDTQNGTSFSNMFNRCSNLTIIPKLDTSQATTCSYMFDRCNKLRIIEGELDFTKMTSVLSASSTFGTNSTKLSSLEEVRFKGSINITISFYCPVLSYDSIKSILTACANKTSTSNTTITFSRTIADNNGELANLIAQCNAKKWTITGLTLT